MAGMALLDWINLDNEPRLEGEGVRLRPPRAVDFSEWARVRAESRDFLQPWEPTWPDDDLTRGAWRRRLAGNAQDIERGVAYPFLIFRAADEAIIGGITLRHIVRGVAQTGSIGYWIGEPFTRQGRATAAVKAVSTFAFRQLGLHRLEAACLPSNLGSQRVLRGAGFAEEGLAKAYLKINGAWRDHLLFGRVSPYARADEHPD
jgi:[ribosomal protein S5]-alanine N-acetyltransferase